MVADGEDELICDFAQTYHVFDWRGLPLRLAATLASGLPEDSRCKRRIAGLPAPMNTVLLATLVDQLGLLLWLRFGKPNTERPASVLDALSGKADPAPKPRSFRTGADFDRELQRYIA